MARQRTQGHGSLGRPKWGELAVFTSGSLALSSSSGSQSWTSMEALRISSDAEAFAELLHSANNSVLSVNNVPSTGHTVDNPYSWESTTAWGRKFFCVAEVLELYMQNVENTGASVCIYVCKTKHPVEAFPISFIDANTSMQRVWRNPSASFANADPQLATTGPISPQYDLGMAAHFWQFFTVVERRKFHLKPGKHRIEKFHLDKYYSYPGFHYNGPPSLTQPGEYFLLFNISGVLLPDAVRTLGPCQASINMTWRDLIRWRQPTPYLEKRYITYSPEIFSANPKYKYVQQSDVDLASSSSSVAAGAF